MNSFLAHHQDSIRLTYSCFDRILLNAMIQPLQRLPSVVWFFRDIRNIGQKDLTKNFFRTLSGDYHRWVEEYADDHNIPLVVAPKGNNIRRDDFVVPYYRRVGDWVDKVAVILKSRENARVVVSRPTRGLPCLEMANRFVWQYYFYIMDSKLGRMFIRICPYFPFNARMCINGHEWLACRLHEKGIHFRKEQNAFLTCSDPRELQRQSDLFDAYHIRLWGGAWLVDLIPFFTDRERKTYYHDYFASQVEYATNYVFHRRSRLDRMHERLLDLNRTIGRPERISMIFGRRIRRETVFGLRTRISDYHLASPVIKSYYKSSSIKQYVRDYLMFRTETTTNNLRDLGINKSIDNIGRMRQKMGAINERYLDVQQDVLETYTDRDHLEKLRQPTLVGKRRVPGIKIDDKRVLALMQALLRFAPLATGGCFRTKDIHEFAAQALGKTTKKYKLSQLRYDLGKLRAKGLVEKVEGTQQYRLTEEGTRLCILFVKLHQRVYAPLTSATRSPCQTDANLPESNHGQLDKLYASVDNAIQDLSKQIGLCSHAA